MPAQPCPLQSRIWALLAGPCFFLCLYYAALSALRLEGMRLNDWQWDIDRLLIFLARGSAKLLTVTISFSLLISIRSVSSSFDYIPYCDRSWMRWRDIHAKIGLLSIVCAAVHIAAHVYRVFVLGDRLWARSGRGLG